MANPTGASSKSISSSVTRRCNSSFKRRRSASSAPDDEDDWVPEGLSLITAPTLAPHDGDYGISFELHKWQIRPVWLQYLGRAPSTATTAVPEFAVGGVTAPGTPIVLYAPLGWVSVSDSPPPLRSTRTRDGTAV